MYNLVEKFIGFSNICTTTERPATYNKLFHQAINYSPKPYILVCGIAAPCPPSSAAYDSRLVFERSYNRLHSWVYILSLWKDGIKRKCQILLQPKMFLFKQKLGNKMTKTCACFLIFNSTFLQSDPEILYAANTILTHLSFFYYYYYSALRNSKESTS